MTHAQQLERDWQLVLAARLEAAHANKVAADKQAALDRALAQLKATAAQVTIDDAHIIVRILEVA